MLRMKSSVTVATLVLAASPAYAHRPFWPAGANGTIATAFPIENPVDSIVVNQVATCDSQVLWLRFDAHAGDQIYIQSGVPKVDRFDSYRPALALLGPGIVGSVPIKAGGLPGRPIDPLTARTTFHDNESSTDSWVYVEGLQPIPETGTYYIAAWPSEFKSGKFWVAVGTVENFTPADLPLFPMWLQEMDVFYEKTAPGDPIVQCTPDAAFGQPDAPAGSGSGESQSETGQSEAGGCQATDGSTSLVALMLVGLCVTGRRYRRRTDAQ